MPRGAATRRPHGAPRLRTAADESGGERHASWLEVFFDLVFVVAVAELGRTVAEDPSPVGFAHYAILFVPVWWAWVGFTFYADRFDVEDLPYRFALLLAMLAMAAVAVSVPRAFAHDSGARAFAGAYVAVRLVLIGLYARAHRHVSEARALTGRYTTGFVAGAVLWAASIAVDGPARWALWAAGMAIELLTPLASSAAIRSVPYDISHIPERFGLFTIIVLGESVTVSTLAVAEEPHLRVGSAAVAVLAFVLAATLWWLYFEFSDDAPLRHWLVAGQTWMYGHLLVFAGITASGEGALLAIRAVGEHETLAGGGRWALCGGLAAVTTALAAIRAATLRDPANRFVLVQLAGVAALVVLGLAGGTLEPAALLGVAVAVMLALIVAESRTVAADASR